MNLRGFRASGNPRFYGRNPRFYRKCQYILMWYIEKYLNSVLLVDMHYYVRSQIHTNPLSTVFVVRKV